MFGYFTNGNIRKNEYNNICQLKIPHGVNERKMKNEKIFNRKSIHPKQRK